MSWSWYYSELKEESVEINRCKLFTQKMSKQISMQDYLNL